MNITIDKSFDAIKSEFDHIIHASSIISKGRSTNNDAGKEASIAPFELLIHSTAPMDIINYSTSHYFIQMIISKISKLNFINKFCVHTRERERWTRCGMRWEFPGTTYDFASFDCLYHATYYFANIKPMRSSCSPFFFKLDSMKMEL